jgi:RNA polymerase sigma-70 factor (ECF subfamily)
MMTNEAELAQRASQRDQDAFAELYTAYVEKIYKYVYYKVGDPNEAEDLCEQVFLKAWEAIGRYTWYGYPFSSWLYRLAHNLVVDHYRTRREILPLNDTLLIREEPIDPEVALARSLGSNDLRRAILRLTPEQRQVICLKFIEGYSNSEIATMMDKKEGAIRALQYRALRSLQAILEAEEAKELEWTPVSNFGVQPSASVA